jgi:ABC-2 type transport system ATP-binding protein
MEYDVIVLRCDGLSRQFGDLRAVDGVGFHIDAGETYGLLGPNGAGKTTVISMLVGLLQPDAGTIEVAGQPMGPRATEVKRLVGYVPQEIAVYPDLTARENLHFFGRLHRLEGRSARVDEVLEVVGLTDRADDRVEEFSGGMQRRLNIGIGLLHRPTLLVLDEPTVGVDPQSRDAILAAIEALSSDGIGVLYTTHYMEEAERLCDRIGIIDGGTLRAEGTRRELVALVGGKDRVLLELSGDNDAVASVLASRPEVEVASPTTDGVELVVSGAARLLPALLEAVAATGATVRGVRVTEPDLEHVFLELTGRALRDA